MSYVPVVLTMLFAGGLFWVVNKYLPLEGTVLLAVNAVIGVVVAIFLYSMLGTSG